VVSDSITVQKLVWFQTMWSRSPDENCCINHALVVPPPGMNIQRKGCSQPIEHSLEGPLVGFPFFLQGPQKKARKGQGLAVNPIIGNPKQRWETAPCSMGSSSPWTTMARASFSPGSVQSSPVISY
jgi:hypothetical protein